MTKTDEQLVDVYRNIDRARVPERFAELLSAIEDRIDAEASGIGPDP